MPLKALIQTIENQDFPMEWPGHWVDQKFHKGQTGSNKGASLNPNDGSTLMEFYLDRQTVELAIDAAEKAEPTVAAMPFRDRVDILSRLRQSLADMQEPITKLLRVEAGRPAWEAQESFEASIRYLEYVVANSDRIHSELLAPARLGNEHAELRLIPIGTTAAYLPFSTPLENFVQYFSACLLAGCPLVLTSSHHAAVSTLFYSEIVQNLDVPDNLLQVVFGNYSSFKQLVADSRVRAVVYTGSREHCDAIRQQTRNRLGRQAVLQSGGKNAVIVHSSADMELAIKSVVYGALKTAGERCTSTSRVFVYRNQAAEFKERLADAFTNVPMGRTDREGDNPFYGPLYSQKAVEKFLRFQTMANRESEKTVLWGAAAEIEGDGFFVTPGIHDMGGNFDNGTAYQGNVLFSPDVAVYDYDVLDEAINSINTTDAAFAVSFIGDPEILADRREMFLAPNLMVNQPTVETEITLPLTGRLQSGHHRFHGMGITLYLCYPQAVCGDSEPTNRLRAWPWPKF